jgi:cysteine desulfurase/selenocysteine lyase
VSPSDPTTLVPSLFGKELFIGLDDVAHLCSGGESPMLKTSRDALVRFVALKSEGMTGRMKILQHHDSTRTAMADYLGAPSPDEIAFVGHAADGMNVLANGIDWASGDEVVSIADEYPDSLLPWLARRADGVRLRTVQPGEGVEDRIAAAMSSRTRVIAISYVSYLTGFRVDIARLASIARHHGAILAVDVSHALGAIPIPIEQCDVVVSCLYKFALGTHGAGLLYVDRARQAELRQRSVGQFAVERPPLEERILGYQLKMGARRYELGNPPFVSLFVLREALDLLNEHGPEAVQQHVWRLGDRLLDGLVALGLDVVTPRERARRATNIAFRTSDPDRIVEQLHERRVLAWSGDGRVRLSLHGYNDSADVDAALNALSGIASARTA